VRAQVPYDTHAVVTAEIAPGAARDKRWHGAGDRLADRRPAAYQLLGRPFEETPAAAHLSAPLIPEQAVAAIAAVQAHATRGAGTGPSDEPSGVDAALNMVAHAAQLGLKVLVLPLFFSTPTWLPDEGQARADAARTPALLQRACRLAAQGGCLIVLPVLAERGGALTSTAVLIGPSGQVIGRHTQVHVEPELRSWCAAGDTFEVFETPFGRLGVILGYDGLFPEATRALALGGADIVAWPCAWRTPQDRALLTVTKAEDNRVYLVCANRTDAPVAGGSLVVSPSGFPHWNVAEMAPPNARSGAVIPTHANLALSRQKLMIPRVDMLRNRLVTTYGPLVANRH
jgi:predicted amidohydrolase